MDALYFEDFYNSREDADLYNRFQRPVEQVVEDTDSYYKPDEFGRYKHYVIDKGTDYRFRDFLQNRVGKVANPMTATNGKMPYGMHEVEPDELFVFKEATSAKEKYLDLLSRYYAGERLSDLDQCSLNHYKNKFGNITENK